LALTKTNYTDQLNSLSLNGKTIKFEQILNEEIQQSNLSDLELYSLNFIRDWLTKKAEFVIKTSGSTGMPKTLVFKRDQLKISAHRTLRTFGLKKGDRVLVCLNPYFVAGKLMLVRSLEGKLKMEIVTPSSNPLRKIEIKEQVDFAAFFPNQLEKILEESPQKLNRIKTILVGGAAIHPRLEGELQEVKSQIFHSYATTETLSHQAIRHVNGIDRSETFHSVEGVSFATDERSCLVINDRLLGLKNLVTNDIVDLIDQSSFRWRGRIDNMVNSGGIKIQLEETEDLIRQVLTHNEIKNKFCLLSKPDRALTESLVLIIEMSKDQMQKSHLLDLLNKHLPKYHTPKEIIFVAKLYITETGKVDRIKNTEEYLNMK
jgi:O-succinylbenzoic acid--CoA ligase